MKSWCVVIVLFCCIQVSLAHPLNGPFFYSDKKQTGPEHFTDLQPGNVIEIPNEGYVYLNTQGLVQPEDGYGFHVWGKPGISLFFSPNETKSWYDYRFIQVITQLGDPLIKTDFALLNAFPFIDPIFHLMLDGKKISYDKVYLDERIFIFTDLNKQRDFTERYDHEFFDAPDWGEFHAETYLVKAKRHTDKAPKALKEMEYIDVIAVFKWGHNVKENQYYTKINVDTPNYSQHFRSATEQFCKELNMLREEAFQAELKTVPEPFKNYFTRMSKPLIYQVMHKDL